MKTINEIDALVGQRIRERRRAMKLTQAHLAEILQISFQQIQKYEKGLNRVSAGRLLQLTEVLRVRPDYFFDRAADSEGNDEATLQRMLRDNPECRDLTDAFRRIANADTRHAIVEFVQKMSEAHAHIQDAC